MKYHFLRLAEIFGGVISTFTVIENIEEYYKIINDIIQKYITVKPCLIPQSQIEMIFSEGEIK